ncbi:MAG: hypothetical protein NC299_09790 [Lachnospiraceae bacterium]|nr:hypothetical protein [Ruminococcus sp.]MCM1275645.1 hypothetical protein [Lachnospiraceae bacterium]
MEHTFTLSDEQFTEIVLAIEERFRRIENLLTDARVFTPQNVTYIVDLEHTLMRLDSLDRMFCLDGEADEK